MEKFLLLVVLAIFASCVDSSSIEEQEIYGALATGLSSTYSLEEKKADFKEFKKNYGYYHDVITSDRTFRSAPDFLFLNKFGSHIEVIKEKYGYPYRVEGSNKLYQAGNMEKLDKLQNDIANRIATIRNDFHHALPTNQNLLDHQRVIASQLTDQKRIPYDSLSDAFLESILQSSQEESIQNPDFLMRELDGITGLIPQNFEPSYFKISLDNSLEEKWQKPLIINQQMNFEEYLKEGTSHPHLAALNFILTFRRFKNEKSYHLTHPLVVFDKGHILPAFAKYTKEGFVINAILPHARGNGIINYGNSRKIDRSLMFLTADDFILAYIFKKDFSAESLKKYLINAQNKTTILYGLAKTSRWNNSASQKYFFHKSKDIPNSRPSVTEMSANAWYKLLGKQAKERDLASSSVKKK